MTLAFSGMVVTVWSYFCYTSLFPILNSFFNSPAVPVKNMLWSSLLAGLLSSLKLVALAITIKLLKRWWLKQNENMQLEKEKINAELQLLKAQIHPDFLFSSLDKLYYYAQNDTPKASHLLLKLSDLLSYMLYECNSSTVPLEKEIKMLRNYLELEKNRLGEQMEADINLIGIAGNKTISPLLLLPFVESSFSYCENNQLEKYWINVELRIREFEFSMKLVNGKISDPLITTQSIENRLTNISRRLAILYKEGYELKITVEPDYMITFVKIQLGEEKILNEPVSMNEETVTQSSFTNYATV